MSEKLAAPAPNWRGRKRRAASQFFRILFSSFLALAAGLGFLAPAGSAGAANPTGTIAYIKNETELHLVQPDGSQDHVIWTAPMVGGVQSGVRYPAWRPDGQEIAFVSDMEQTVSTLQSDLFAVRPDGSGLRKLSDAPLHSRLGSFAKGEVDVRVTNENISDSLYMIYVEGAAQAQTTTVAAGTTKTVVFQNVAIFPGEAQFPVAVNGITRWIGQPDTPTFQPGVTNGASIYISADGNDDFGGILPVWTSDSQQVDYNLGQGCVGQALPVNPAPGTTWGTQLASFTASMCFMDRGPTQALANQLVYWDYEGNFPNGGLMGYTDGDSQPALLVDTGYGNTVYGVNWLRDGSGVLFSLSLGSCGCGNIYQYDFTSQQVTQLTHFTQDYVGKMSLSPDGGRVVFEVYTVDPSPFVNPDAVPDLWMMDVSGANQGLFISGARDPSWGVEHLVQQSQVFLPFIR